MAAGYLALFFYIKYPLTFLFESVILASELGQKDPPTKEATMRQLLGCVAVLVVLGLSGCEKWDQKPSAFSPAIAPTVQTTESFNLTVAVTTGNHTYIPINRFGDPAEYVHNILGLVEAFEQKHPELEVTSFQMEKNQSGYATSAFIYGLWLHHRPKASCPK